MFVFYGHHSLCLFKVTKAHPYSCEASTISCTILLHKIHRASYSILFDLCNTLNNAHCQYYKLYYKLHYYKSIHLFELLFFTNLSASRTLFTAVFHYSQHPHFASMYKLNSGVIISGKILKLQWKRKTGLDMKENKMLEGLFWKSGQ